MSSKKDSFNSLDKQYMKFAINLAKNRKGLTGLNPSVGCVIVKNNEIISFGQTGHNGRPHAEFEAIKKCKKNKLNESSIYITLEPCTHYGKTPPCVNSIIKSNIKKVIYSINDIDKRTAYKADKLLKIKKIKVSKGLLGSEAKQINKNYFIHKNLNKPFVAAKIACSKDNFISSKKKIITNHHSRKVSHLLRYYFDAILVSSKTINSDNSRLNCRINGLEKYSPKRLIIDKDLKIKKNSFVIKDNKKNSTIIFHSTNNKRKIDYFKSRGIKLYFVELDKTDNINLDNLFSKAYKIGIGSIIIEGGRILTKTLLKDKLINEFYLFKSKKNLGKLGRNNISDFKKRITSFLKKKKNIQTFLDGDEITKYY